MKNISNFKKNNKKGFSMGEVLIAVFILGVTMVTISQLFIVSLKNFANTRDSIVASMLAQEGIELIKNVRDNNWVNSNSSFNNLNVDPTRKTCKIDSIDSSCHPVVCVGTLADNCTLLYDNISNIYRRKPAPGASNTKFKRVIRIGISANSAKVRSFVSWNPSGGFPVVCDIAHKCIFSQTMLTKWGE